MIRPPQEYHYSAPPTLLILFDLSDPAAVERLLRERAPAKSTVILRLRKDPLRAQHPDRQRLVLRGLSMREPFLKIAFLPGRRCLMSS
jgi:hypothetical protein